MDDWARELLAPRPGCFTFDDFCCLAPETRKADLIDGTIYFASPESTDDNQLTGWLLSLLGGYCDTRDLGEVYAYKVAFRIDDRNAPEPDIAFVRADHAHRIRREWVEGAPDLALEVVTPDSVERDYVVKRELYRRAGVSEYWLVDPYFQRVTVLGLNADGRYDVIGPIGGELVSRTIPGLRFRADWLWDDTSAFTLLERLLGEYRDRPE